MWSRFLVSIICILHLFGIFIIYFMHISSSFCWVGDPLSWAWLVNIRFSLFFNRNSQTIGSRINSQIMCHLSLRLLMRFQNFLKEENNEKEEKSQELRYIFWLRILGLSIILWNSSSHSLGSLSLFLFYY